MALAPSSQIGPYRIEALLGTGGMGEVYRARDTRLNRTVALKLLRTDKLGDSGRRLLHEAQSASALNHPNIVTIYDVLSVDGVDVIVMEHVAGKTLDELIAKKALRLNQSLRYAVQIADALAAAHAAGIIHRDLKPANVIVTETGTAKVLDFGLAKLSEQPAGGDATMTVATAEGTIVGTASYMSPEQAEGKPLDARSDVFSFGCVLYEMVTGRRAFRGDSPISTLSAVLKSEPEPVARIAPDVPREAERLIVRCLRKDLKRRAQSMHDLKIALEDLIEESESGTLTAIPAARPRRSRATAAVLVAAAVITAAGLWSWSRQAPSQAGAPLNARPLAAASGRELAPTFSPEGDRVAYTWTGPNGDNSDIYVRLIGGESAQRLTTNPAVDTRPAWSPDGRSIAFLRGTQDKRFLIVIPAIGGSEKILAEFARGSVYNVGTLSWSADSRHIVVPAPLNQEAPTSLLLISTETLERRSLTTPPAGIMGDAEAALSPDNRSIVFQRVVSESKSHLYRLVLDDRLAPVGDPVKLDVPFQSFAGLAWTKPNQLIVAAGYQSASELYRVTLDNPSAPVRLGLAQGATHPSLSRDGNRLAFSTQRDTNDIWRIDGLDTASPALVKFAELNSSYGDFFPQISPDGKRIAYETDRTGSREIWTADRDGANAARLTSFNGPFVGGPRWSPDSQQILFHAELESRDLHVIPASGGVPRRLTNDPAREAAQNWSRDGKWIYFGSNRTGTSQVWKMPAAGGDAVQVTRGGGSIATESVDGKDLYYVKGGLNATPVWRMPASGGEEQPFLPPILNSNAWAVTARGIYFIPYQRIDGKYTLQFHDFATRRVKTIMPLSGLPQHGLTITPDGTVALLCQQEGSEADIMLVDNFH